MPLFVFADQNSSPTVSNDPITKGDVLIGSTTIFSFFAFGSFFLFKFKNKEHLSTLKLLLGVIFIFIFGIETCQLIIVVNLIESPFDAQMYQALMITTIVLLACVLLLSYQASALESSRGVENFSVYEKKLADEFFNAL